MMIGIKDMTLRRYLKVNNIQQQPFAEDGMSKRTALWNEKGLGDLIDYSSATISPAELVNAAGLFSLVAKSSKMKNNGNAEQHDSRSSSLVLAVSLMSTLNSSVADVVLVQVLEQTTEEETDGLAGGSPSMTCIASRKLQWPASVLEPTYSARQQQRGGGGDDGSSCRLSDHLTVTEASTGDREQQQLDDDNDNYEEDSFRSWFQLQKKKLPGLLRAKLYRQQQAAQQEGPALPTSNDHQHDLLLACVSTSGQVFVYNPWLLFVRQQKQKGPVAAPSFEFGDGMASLLLGGDMLRTVQDSHLPLTKPLRQESIGYRLSLSSNFWTALFEPLEKQRTRESAAPLEWILAPVSPESSTTTATTTTRDWLMDPYNGTGAGTTSKATVNDSNEMTYVQEREIDASESSPSSSTPTTTAKELKKMSIADFYNTNYYQHRSLSMINFKELIALGILIAVVLQSKMRFGFNHDVPSPLEAVVPPLLTGVPQLVPEVEAMPMAESMPESARRVCIAPSVVEDSRIGAPVERIQPAITLVTKQANKNHLQQPFFMDVKAKPAATVISSLSLKRRTLSAALASMPLSTFFRRHGTILAKKSKQLLDKFVTKHGDALSNVIAEVQHSVAGPATLRVAQDWLESELVVAPAAFSWLTRLIRPDTVTMNGVVVVDKTVIAAAIHRDTIAPYQAQGKDYSSLLSIVRSKLTDARDHKNTVAVFERLVNCGEIVVNVLKEAVGNVQDYSHHVLESLEPSVNVLVAHSHWSRDNHTRGLP